MRFSNLFTVSSVAKMDVKQKLKKKLKVQFNAERIHCYNFILWFLLHKIKDSLLNMLHTYSKFLVIAS